MRLAPVKPPFPPMDKTIPASWGKPKRAAIGPMELRPIPPKGAPTILDALKPASQLLATGPNQMTDFAAASDAQTAPPAAPQQRDEFAGIAPIPVDRFDGKSWLRQAVSIAMTPMPGETAEQMSLRVQKMADFNKKIDQMGMLSPDEAQTIFGEWYGGMAPQEDSAFSTFSPDAQAALQEAYGPAPKMHTIAGVGDIDRNEALALAAYGIANMLTGKGNFGDVIRSAVPLQQRAQERLNADNQKSLREDEIRRQAALEKYKRISEVEDQNAKQKGYLAHDLRLLQRQQFADLARGARDTQKADATQNKTIMSLVAKYSQEGDPERLRGLNDYIQSLGYAPLPDSVLNAKPTIKQQKTLAEIGLIGDNSKRVKALTEKIGFQNDVDAATFDDQVQVIRNKAEKGDDEIKKLEFEIEHLPYAFRSKLAVANAQVVSLRARASAALTTAAAARTRAAKAGTSGDSTKDLRAMITSLNTSIDNKMQDINSLAREIDSWKLNKQRANALADKDPDAPNPSYDAKIRELQERLTKIDGLRQTQMRQVDDSIKKLDKTSSGAK